MSESLRVLGTDMGDRVYVVEQQVSQTKCEAALESAENMYQGCHIVD